MKICFVFVLVKDPSASWTLRQSRSALLAVALKEACPNLLNDQWESRVMEQVLAFSSVDRVRQKFVVEAIEGVEKTMPAEFTKQTTEHLHVMFCFTAFLFLLHLFFFNCF